MSRKEFWWRVFLVMVDEHGAILAFALAWVLFAVAVLLLHF